MKYKRDKSVSYLINILGRQFSRALQERTQDLGVVSGQFPALLFLWEEEGITQSELCRLIQVEQPTMANTLKRMERDGLIERKPDPEDKRRSRIFLTERAKSLHDPVIGCAKEVNKIAMEGLSKQEKKIFLKAAGQILLNLEADDISRNEASS